MAGETAHRIGERIRTRRLELGLNQRKLAERIPNAAVNNQRVSDWERGVHQPSERHLAQLATALDVDVAYFFTPPEPSLPTPPLLNLLEGDGERLEEISELLKQLVERQRLVEESVAALAQVLADRLPAEQPRRRRAS